MPKQKKKFQTKYWLKTARRYRKKYSLKRYALNPFLRFLLKSKPLLQKISIRISPNNIFCTFVNKFFKTIHIGSGGKYKIKITKKKLAFNLKMVLQCFFSKIKPMLKTKYVLLKIIAPIRIRKKLIKLLSKHLKTTTNIFIKVEHKKCFNGCRAAKKRRKKRTGFKMFKKL